MTHMRPRARFSRRRRLPRTIGSRRRHYHRRRRRGRRRRRRRRCGCLARATPACARPRSGPAAAAAQGAGSRAGCAAQPSGGRRRLAHGQHAAACSPPHVLTVCQTGVASRQASRQRLWPRWPALAQQTRAQLRSVCARAAEQPPRTSQAASVIRRLRTAEQSRQLGSLSTCPAASPSEVQEDGQHSPTSPRFRPLHWVQAPCIAGSVWAQLGAGAPAGTPPGGPLPPAAARALRALFSAEYAGAASVSPPHETVPAVYHDCCRQALADDALTLHLSARLVRKCP